MHMSSLKRAVSSDMQKLKNQKNMGDREKEKTDWIRTGERAGQEKTGQDRERQERAGQRKRAARLNVL